MKRGISSVERVRVVVRGAVQGVGFRPCVHRLATELGLVGWVRNGGVGVVVELEGPRPLLERFLLRIEKEKPPRSVIQGFEFSFLDPVGYGAFEIRESDAGGERSALILPDIATCPECVREMRDPGDRRHRYPFINCTHCGPRFSIIEALPYDRGNTSMRRFAMCPACEAEYRDPRDRRFHAQPIACPKCGPQLELWDEDGRVLGVREDALLRAAAAVRSGRILAFKGIGGFQLIVDARDEGAVRRLRERKRREEKPFALMYPSLDAAGGDCMISPLEQRLLMSPEAPVVLLERRADSAGVAPAVAPGNPNLGVFLPYSPLHHLLLGELGFPVVATSGNLSDEPICIDEREALERLRGIADAFLVHDRPIVRHVDDSVARVVLGRELVLRRGRGYAPLPVMIKAAAPGILGVGAQQKNAIALGVGGNIFISQHIGDLESVPAHGAFRAVAADFQRLCDVRPEAVACDMHPDYLSTRYARELGVRVVPVQHHHAHVAACMAENELNAPVLGVSWDGTGFGPDGTIWGGEFLRVEGASYARVAHFRTFRLPGGEAAVREPRRSALGLLYALFGEQAFDRRDMVPLREFSDPEIAVLRQALAKGVNSPMTSSAGRLFDAVASLLGLRQRVRFEGQAAMELEFAVRPGVDDAYPVADGVVVDWGPMILALVADEAPVGVIAARFHNTLADAVVAVARRVGECRVALTGGCFQNRYLTERAVKRLREEGFRPYWHQRVPPNDGGIALGQVVVASRAAERSPRGRASSESIV